MKKDEPLLVSLATDVLAGHVKPPENAETERAYQDWITQVTRYLHQAGGTAAVAPEYLPWAYRGVEEGRIMLVGENGVALPGSVKIDGDSPLGDLLK